MVKGNKMRFKDFLNEAELPSVPSTKKVTSKVAVEWAKKNAPQVMKNLVSDKFHFYRGVEGSAGDYQIGDSTTFKRVSKNTRNYYTKFFATSKNWSSYPSRESCFIGATNPSIAESYGEVFAIIPADNAHLGICPAHDLWKSFPVLEEAFAVKSLNSFIEILIEVMKAQEGKVIEDNDIASLREAMKRWSMKDMHDFAVGLFKHKQKIPKYAMDKIAALTEFMVEHKLPNFEAALEHCLDPKLNGFEKMAAKNCDKSPRPGLEMWVEGQALFVRKSELKQFIEDYNA